MKNHFFSFLAVLLIFTSCSLDESLSPVDHRGTQAIPTLDSSAEVMKNDASTCTQRVIYRVDEEQPCGFYLFWEKQDIAFVPKSLELFQSTIDDNTHLVIGIDEESFEPDFCEIRAGFDVTCLSLEFSYQDYTPNLEILLGE